MQLLLQQLPDWRKPVARLRPLAVDRIEKEEARTTLKAKPNAPVLVNIRNRQARQIVVTLNTSLEKAEALCLTL